MVGYALISGSCLACGGSTAVTIATVAWYGVANCAVCTGTSTKSSYVASSTTAGTPSISIVTCTQCAATYALIPIVTLTAGKANGIATPFCYLSGATTITSPYATAPSTTADGNDASLVITGPTAMTVPSGCFAGLTATTTSTTATVTLALNGCINVASGSYCSIATLTAPTCSTSAPTTPAPGTGCIGGYYTASVFTCTACTANTYTLISGACVVNMAGCTVMATATWCATWATSGFALPNSTLTTQYGFLNSGQYLLSNGTAVTGAGGVSNCLIYNATGVCVWCNPGYVSATTNCTACTQAGCASCTASACTVCSATYTLSTTAGTCSKSNCTNVTANGSCSYSKNMIATGLAFVSMIFYYIF